MTDEKALDDACGKLGELLKPAYLSTLSPDVSGLVERLRVWAAGSGACLDTANADDFTAIADALASLSLQLAAVEGASVAPSPEVHVVGSVAYARVRVDTMPDEDGWCFCTPFNHPDDVDRGLTNGETSDQSQFFGQISPSPQPKSEAQSLSAPSKEDKTDG